MKRENNKRVSEIVSQLDGLERSLSCCEEQLKPETKLKGYSIKIEPTGYSIWDITKYIQKDIKEMLVVLAIKDIKEKIKILETELETL